MCGTLLWTVLTSQTFWTAVGSLAAIGAFYYAYQLYRNADDTLTLALEQSKLLKEQIERQREDRKKDEQRYHDRVVSNFENSDMQTSIRVTRKADGKEGELTIFYTMSNVHKQWHMNFVDDKGNVEMLSQYEQVRSNLTRRARKEYNYIVE